MIQRREIERTAFDAVTLLLYLGEDSFDDEAYARDGVRPDVSPLAGKRLSVKQMNIVTAGNRQGEGDYHVVITAETDAGHIEAYCSVLCGTERILLIRPHIFVGGMHMSHRIVQIKQHGLKPWAMPEGFDISAAIEASRIEVDV